MLWSRTSMLLSLLVVMFSSVLLAADARSLFPAAEPSHHDIHGTPRVTRPEQFALQPAPGGPLAEGLMVPEKPAFTVGHHNRTNNPFGSPQAIDQSAE